MFRCFLIAVLLIAQTAVRAQTGIKYNQTDSLGRRTGQWVEKPGGGMGDDVAAEWGSYVEGRKVGAWYRYDREARVISIENFRAGVRHGEAKYFEDGVLSASGTYLGLRTQYKFDTVWVTDPITDVVSRRIIATDQGSLRDGTWRYYDPRTGRLTRVLKYVLDEVVDRRDMAIAPADSAWYRKQEQLLAPNQKRQYRLPRGRDGFSLTK